MPSPDQTAIALRGFLKARTWDDSRRILNAHPELLNVGIGLIDIILKDPPTISMIYPGRTRSDAESLLKTHRAVIARCRQVGVARAFAEIGGQGRSSSLTSTRPAVQQQRKRKGPHPLNVTIGVFMLLALGAVAVSIWYFHVRWSW